MVTAETPLVAQGRLGNEIRGLTSVKQPHKLLGKRRMAVEIMQMFGQIAQVGESPAQAGLRAHDTHVVPHDMTDTHPVLRHKRGIVIMFVACAFPVRNGLEYTGADIVPACQNAGDVVPCGDPPEQCFQQGCAGQPVGAVDAGVAGVIRLLGGREKWLIPILMLFFGLGGTTYGMWEETMAFFPLLLPIFLAAGYDAVVGVAVILLGAGAGVIASTVNPFATGIAAGFAGVSLGEGLLWRLIQFVIFEGAAIWYVSAYAARIKRDPSRSVVGIGAGRLHADVGRVQPLTRRHAAILLIFAATFLTMIYGVIPFDEMGLPLPVLGWWFPELSALFLVAGIVVGLMDRLSEVELAETFVSGCTDLLGVAFIIGISRGITVLMNDGHITDTILHWGETALSGLGSTSFVLLVFLIYLPLSVLIPSSSGLATLSVPVVAPLGQFAGVGGDVVVTAFQSACGLVNLVTPTAAVVMGALALGRIPYEKWLKFVWKLMLLFLLLTGLLLVLAAALS